MSRFKKGDKALVVGGRAYLGQEVEIVEWLSPGESVDFGGGPIMFDTRVNYGCWLVTPDGQWSTLKRDKWLMPLKGDDQPQEIQQQEITS